jgi:4-amino-4-deoxy-L-arabinose transferase-like glycosyltransferase
MSSLKKPLPEMNFSQLARTLPRTHTQAMFILILSSLLLFLPGFFSIPPTDRDESRFAQATKQMVEAGDYVNIRFQNDARNKKPIGIYWLQAAAVKLSGLHEKAPIWVYRLPSLLGAMCAVLLTYWALLPIMRKEEAFYAALLLSACILLSVEARLAKTDAVLLATTTAAMGALLRVFFEREKTQKSTLLIFWLLLAFGFLIKGPLILLVTGSAMLALCFYELSGNWLKNFRPLPGIALFTIIVAPWFIAIFFETGGAFFADSLGHDMFAKLAGGQESHGAPPGTYLALVWLTFFPSACFLAAGIPYLWQNRRQEKIILLFCWLVPLWPIFEFIPTKLPHYVLPAYPALAAFAVLACKGQGWRMVTRWQRFCMSSLLTLPPLLLAGLFILQYWRTDASDWILLTLIILVACLGLLAFKKSRTDVRITILLMIANTALLYFCIFGRFAPRSEELLLSSDIVQSIQKDAPCDHPALASAGYHEPSLVFLTSKDILLTDGKGAADFLLQDEKACRIALVEENENYRFFERRLREEGRQARHLALAVGRNVNGGHLRRIGLWMLQ